MFRPVILILRLVIHHTLIVLLKFWLVVRHHCRRFTAANVDCRRYEAGDANFQKFGIVEYLNGGEEPVASRESHSGVLPQFTDVIARGMESEGYQVEREQQIGQTIKLFA